MTAREHSIWWLMFTVAIALLILVTVVIPSAEALRAGRFGRWVDFGKWNGVVACESSPTANYPHIVPRKQKRRYRAEVRVDQINRWSGASGAFQFLPWTWDSVARKRNRPNLESNQPRSTTLAQQLRQAQWLRENVGIRQWSCGWRYGDGTGPRYVTGERREPRRPAKCARNLRRRHGLTWPVSESVCNR